MSEQLVTPENVTTKDGKQVLKPIKDKRKLEILDNIFLQVQNLINKKDCGKDEK